MTDDVLAQVRQIAADVLSLPVDAITAESSPGTLEGWDSLKHVSFMMAIEQAFGIEVLPEEMADVRCIGDAELLVRRKRA